MAEMTGSLIKRSEHSYSIVLYLGRDPVTGKKRQKWHTFNGNKKGAEKEMTRLLHELQTGTYIEPNKLTVKDYLLRWLSDYAKVNVAPRTFERYKAIVEQHLVPELGAIQLVKLSPLHVQAAHAKAMNDGGRKDGRQGGLSAQTVLHHHRVLSEALKQAVRWQLVPRNVCEAVEPPRPVEREVKALEESATAWLLDAAHGTRLEIPILLAVTTGMRRGEILALRWQDVNLDAGLLTIRRSIQETKAQGLTFKEPKSRKGRRTLTLPAIAIEMLRAHRSVQGTRKASMGTDYQDNDLICCRDDGSIWPPSAFTSAYRALLGRRKLGNIRFHDLRHSHASQLLRAGISPKVIQERLGHSKVGFTLDVYSHLLPGMQEEAARKVDAGLRLALQEQRRNLV
ncbi:MAG: site-specific integrase [Bryobacteraceae bacterium]